MLYFETVAAASETAMKILARRASVKGAWQVLTTCNGGSTASVSWQFPRVTLNMPSLPADSQITRAEADRLVAYIAHECCHVLHTDWNDWRRAVALGPRVRHWVNAMEDVRIERTEIRNGAFPNLRNLLASLCDRKHFEAVMESAKVGRVIGAKVADAPYVVCILGRLQNDYDVPTARMLPGSLSPDVKRLVDYALRGLPKCRSTMAVLRLAQELVAMERTMQQPAGAPGEPGEGQEGDGAPGEPGEGQEGDGAPGEPGEGQEGDGAPGEPGEGAAGTPPGVQEGDGAPGEPGEGAAGTPPGVQEGDGAPEEGDEAPEEGEGAPGTPEDEAGHGPELDPNANTLEDMVRQIARRAGIDNLKTHLSGSAEHVLNTTRARIGRQDPRPSDRNQAAAERLNALLTANSVLHGQVSRLLVSDEVHRRTHHETSGRLDRRALVRMRAGALDVFSKRDDTPGIDTALLVLIDGSGSMNAGVDDFNAGKGTRMDMAKATAWAVAKAAESANAKVAVAAFHTPVENVRAKMHHADIWLLKDWTVSVAESAAIISHAYGHSYTPLSQSIIGAAEYLREANATRRILLVLTDGACELGARAVTAACNIAADMGVETVGLGMACPEVVDAFPPGYSENITDLAHLAREGMRVLTAMLEDANQRGAD
jgi:Mg-chelatase subunit ChlD